MLHVCLGCRSRVCSTVPLSHSTTAGPHGSDKALSSAKHHGDPSSRPSHLQPSTPRRLNPINSGPRTCALLCSSPNPGTLILQGPVPCSRIHPLFLQPESARATRELPPLWSRNLRASELSALLGFKTPSASCAPPPEPRYDRTTQSLGSSSSCITAFPPNVEKKPLFPPHA